MALTVRGIKAREIWNSLRAIKRRTLDSTRYEIQILKLAVKPDGEHLRQSCKVRQNSIRTKIKKRKEKKWNGKKEAKFKAIFSTSYRQAQSGKLQPSVDHDTISFIRRAHN